ncbi:response regulator [Paenibacillus sp. GCM10012307]|uniref:Response regulator n=1 Tax=Paenibacillus roseus TaxID=2798579 RepID=A0A934IYJ2_9BACL|nr:response regulator [Paenibacillus roseus]MBJ6361591.1 response regulator [Paenibacillus roseus]
MKLKALLVDDEVHILNNLSKVLPWAEMGFEIIGLARSGVDALETAILHQPDLILSDIRMPVMDGITLVRQVREQGLTCEILLLSGYQEFEYARTALRYGVRDYICKPINYMELEQTVQDIARQINEQKKRQAAELRLQEAAVRIQDTRLLHALLGLDQETGAEFEEEGEAGEKNRYGILLVDLEGYAHQSIMWKIRDRKAWNLRLTTVLKDMLAPQLVSCTVLQLREGEWCVVFENSIAKDEMTREEMKPGYERLQAVVNEKEGMMIRMCVEKSQLSMRELGPAYQRLQQILIRSEPEEWYLDAGAKQSESGLLNSGGALDATEPQWLWIEQIGSGLRGGNQELLAQVMNELKCYIGHLNEGQAGRVEKVLHYLLIYLLREMRELQMLSGGQEEMIWLRLQGALSLKELLSLIMSLIEQAKESLMGKKSSERLMMAAQSYIQQHLGKDFGIEDIADYLGISCSYFCLLFKNYFGETFVEHLTRQRIEAAKSLLGGSDKSITHIGSVVGYQERRYFTKVFQKYTGMTPSEYRMKESSAI